LKKIFYILIIVLAILIIIYFSKGNKEIVNYEYSEENIDIMYPKFGDDWLDEYINDYVNLKLNDFKYGDYDYCFLDYDYNINDNNLDLVFYYYKYSKSLYDSGKELFKIDLDSHSINKTKDTNDKEYDIYMNKVVSKDSKMVAFTFDDGPSHNTNKIISILNKYGVRATFFLLGTNINNNLDVLNNLYNSGMEIGNHSYSHKLLTRLSKEKVEEEFNKTSELIYNNISIYPTVFRPSYGSVNKKIKSVVKGPIILWNIDTLDWKHHNSNYIYNKIVNKVKDGDIILMHDIYSATENAIEKVIPELLRRGFKIVTVSELFYYKNIELNNGSVYRYAKK
jgi:peptidoglycan-N-acetylglucosamine deacetylase